ncbi:MAG: Rossmann fold domain-containing protein [Pseudomonadota bacterium]
MSQVVHTIPALPEAPLEAAAAYFADHHAQTCALIADESVTSLVVLMETAATDHDAWRRALAGDLARAFAPRRCNVIGAASEEAAAPLLSYLEGAHGLTGQYLASYE